MNGLRRFFSLGLQQADRRLSALTTPVKEDDRVALEIVESSTVFQVLSRVLFRAHAALDSSVVLLFIRGAHSGWQQAHLSSRTFAIGMMLATSGATYIALNSLLTTPAGRLWLIIPVTAIANGGLLIIASAFARRGVDELRRDRSEQHVGKRF